MNVLAMVLGRADSKGLPNKNKLHLCGKQILQYTIDQLNQCRHTMRKVISSNIPEVVNLATKAGFEFVDRPKRLYTDDVGTREVTKYIVEVVESTGWVPKILIEAYICVPIRPVRCFERLVDVLIDDPDAGSAFFVTPTQPPTHLVQIRNGRSHFPFGVPVSCRQHNEPIYKLSGAAFVMRRNVYMTSDDVQRRYYDVPLVAKPDEVVDIDSLEDFARAESLLRLRENPPQ